MAGATLVLLVIRAALVPSRPFRTAWLTLTVGVPVAVATALPRLPPRRPARPGRKWDSPMVVADVLQIIIWWTITTITCVVISRVIYGLRRRCNVTASSGSIALEEKLGRGRHGHRLPRPATPCCGVPRPSSCCLPEQAGETTLARFEREVQLTARLTHPNTITIFDYGRTPDGVFYYAMELLEGATARRDRALRRRPARRTRRSHPRGGRRRAGGGPRHRPDSPRHQAGQHHAVRAGRRPDVAKVARLRPGQGR